MEFDGWIEPCKVRAFPWIGSNQIYCNVQYYAPGQSIEQPPVLDKSVLITDNEAGRQIVNNYMHSLVEYITKMKTADSHKIPLLTFLPSNTLE